MSLIKIEAKTILKSKTKFKNNYSYKDPFTKTYISAIEEADGQELETGVIEAIDDFIVGLKTDGIWDSLKASCILAGARTLNGALIPLVGTAPTNSNFENSDYNRKTGLKGNGSNKSLSTNRNNNQDPAANRHISVYTTEKQQTSSGTYLGGVLIGSAVPSSIIFSNQGLTSRLTLNSAALIGNNASTLNLSEEVGLVGISRSNTTSVTGRTNKTNTTGNFSYTATPGSATLRVFSQSNSTSFSNGRISFYSIGEFLDLAKLDDRVSALMSALNSAI